MTDQIRKGDPCYLYYDGKRGRGVKGECIAHRGLFILVRFTLWADTKTVESWLVQKQGGYCGWIRHDDSLMKGLFGARKCPGDWYRALRHHPTDYPPIKDPRA